MSKKERNIRGILTVGMAEATQATTAAFAPANTPSVYRQMRKG